LNDARFHLPLNYFCCPLRSKAHSITLKKSYVLEMPPTVGDSNSIYFKLSLFRPHYLGSVRILVALLASLNSPFKGNLLLLRDCNEIMGSVLYGSWNDHHQLTCGDVMACSVGQG
jgi:hypothetical protein